MGLLRVLLAVSVFMVHAPQSTWNKALGGFGGSNAVEIFFVISGFYMALILEKSYLKKGRFYRNRILRLFPIYYLVCGLILLRTFLFPNSQEFNFSFPTQAVVFGGLANSTFIGSDWLTFLEWKNGHWHFGNFNESGEPLSDMLLVPQSWSIGIEVTFYLLAPLLCKFKSRTLIFLILGTLVSRLVGLYFGLDHDPWTYRFFPFEIPMFLIGILLYRLRARIGTSHKVSQKMTRILLVTSYVLFSLLSWLISFNRFWQMLFLLALVIVILVWGEESTKDRKIGELSYPIYLSHILVITTYIGLVQLISKKIMFFELFSDPILATPISLALTILFSILLNRIVIPIERSRDKNRS
jgi:peptidoglycan/LPS O-acetylase OafA/YrhL